MADYFQRMEKYLIQNSTVASTSHFVESAWFCAGMVETLVNTGRQIDAVYFAYAFQLMESFPPVPLLKAYLDEVMKNVQEICGNAENPGAQVCVWFIMFICVRN